jgi:hypothetical protein
MATHHAHASDDVGWSSNIVWRSREHGTPHPGISRRGRTRIKMGRSGPIENIADCRLVSTFRNRVAPAMLARRAKCLAVPDYRNRIVSSGSCWQVRATRLGPTVALPTPTLSESRRAAASTYGTRRPIMTTYQPSTIPELLPWADPYIAGLHRQHAHDLRREETTAESNGFICRAQARHARRPSRGESRPLERMTPSRRLSALAW